MRETLSHEAVELSLYADNDYGCYKAYILPMLVACQKHYDKGQGDYERVVPIHSGTWEHDRQVVKRVPCFGSP
jgi:hypothetical protein